MAQDEQDFNRLRADLRRMGIQTGDELIIHSSMKSIGRVRGGPRTVIRALQEAVGPKGALIMPTFSYCFEKVYSPAAAYDRKTSPSRTGLLTEAFRKCRGVLRSGHPTHSVAVWGRLAKELTAGHEHIGGLDVGSPFHHAACLGAKVCMIGCDFTSLSLLHVAEALAEAPYLGIFNWWHAGLRPTALMKERGGRTAHVGYATVPGCGCGFVRVQSLAQRRGMLREAKLGNARVLLFNAAEILDLAARRIRQQPDYLLCPPGKCRPCDERRVVFEKEESPGAAAVGGLILDILDKAPYRLAGGDGERKAAELIAGRMRANGLANVRIEEFPITAWEPGFSAVEIFLNGNWEKVPSAPVAHSPSTRGRTVEGKVVQVEAFGELPKLRDVHSAVGVLLDGYGGSVKEFRRLMNWGFRALILVSRRFHHEDLMASGVPSRWLGHFKLPMASIPFQHAARLFGHGATRCRIRVGGRRAPGKSQNVLGEIPGRERGAILVTAHHDSTFNDVGADDNLTGVALMMQIASALARIGKPRRTIRFCSFGAEEQLSEGARWYALESGGATDVRFVLNSDTGGARVGTSGILVTGSSDLAEWARSQARRSALQFTVTEDIGPFSDHFPLNVAGAPSLCFSRRTLAAGRHFHHTVRDTPAEVSFGHIARLAEFQAGLIRKLAWSRRFPFPTSFPPKLKRRTAQARKDWLER